MHNLSRDVGIWGSGWAYTSPEKTKTQQSILFLLSFLITGCDDCQTIILELKNGALEKQSGMQGLYQASDCYNGRKSWTSSLNFIWYVPEYQEWHFGPLDGIGLGIISIGHQGDLNCPYNVTNDNWQYWDGRFWILPEDVNDISIRCFQGYFLLKIVLTLKFVLAGAKILAEIEKHKIS